MFCKYCENELGETDKICNKCGKEVDQMTEKTVENVPEKVVENQQKDSIKEMQGPVRNAIEEQQIDLNVNLNESIYLPLMLIMLAIYWGAIYLFGTELEFLFGVVYAIPNILLLFKDIDYLEERGYTLFRNRRLVVILVLFIPFYTLIYMIYRAYKTNKNYKMAVIYIAIMVFGIIAVSIKPNRNISYKTTNGVEKADNKVISNSGCEINNDLILKKVTTNSTGRKIIEKYNYYSSGAKKSMEVAMLFSEEFANKYLDGKYISDYTYVEYQEPSETDRIAKAESKSYSSNIKNQKQNMSGSIMKYDADYRIIEEDEDDGEKCFWTYDASGNLLEVNHQWIIDGKISPYGVSYEYDDKNVLIKKFAWVDDHVVGKTITTYRYDYDEKGLPKVRYQYDNDEHVSTTVITRNEQNLIVKEEITDSEGKTDVIEYIRCFKDNIPKQQLLIDEYDDIKNFIEDSSEYRIRNEGCKQLPHVSGTYRILGKDFDEIKKVKGVYIMGPDADYGSFVNDNFYMDEAFEKYDWYMDAITYEIFGVIDGKVEAYSQFLHENMSTVIDKAATASIPAETVVPKKFNAAKDLYIWEVDNGCYCQKVVGGYDDYRFNYVEGDLFISDISDLYVARTPSIPFE